MELYFPAVGVGAVSVNWKVFHERSTVRVVLLYFVVARPFWKFLPSSNPSFSHFAPITACPYVNGLR